MRRLLQRHSGSPCLVRAALSVLVVLSVWFVALPAGAAGTPPSVSAGPDQQITAADVAFLHPTVSDDGLPDGLGLLSGTWTQVSGPVGVSFDDSKQLLTLARFPGAGSYTLRLTVSDGDLVASDEMLVTVASAHATSRW